MAHDGDDVLHLCPIDPGDLVIIFADGRRGCDITSQNGYKGVGQSYTYTLGFIVIISSSNFLSSLTFSSLVL